METVEETVTTPVTMLTELLETGETAAEVAKIEAPIVHLKAQVLQDNLIAAIKKVKGFAAKRTTLPILEGIQLLCEGGRMRVSATNLEGFAEVYIGVKSEDDFRTVIPADKLNEVVGMLSGLIDLDLTMRTQNTVLSAEILADKKSKKAIKQKVTLKGYDWQEFPLIPYCDQVIAKISMKDLSRLTGRAKTAVATDESRPILTGINLVIKDNTLTVAAADGFRLVVDSARVTDGVNGTYLVPGRILCDFVNIADEDDVIEIRARGEWKSKIELNEDEEGVTEIRWFVAKFIQFASPFVSVTCGIIDGKFPDYEEIIPKKPTVLVTVDRKELLAGLKSALVFKKKMNFPGCELRIGGEYPRDMLDVFAQSPELGDSSAEVKAEFIGHMVHMMININYLADAVKNLTEGAVTLEFTPGILNPLRITEDAFTQVVMPMHIGDSKDKKWTVRFVAPEAQLVAEAIAEEIVLNEVLGDEQVEREADSDEDNLPNEDTDD